MNLLCIRVMNVVRVHPAFFPSRSPSCFFPYHQDFCCDYWAETSPNSWMCLSSLLPRTSVVTEFPSSALAGVKSSLLQWIFQRCHPEITNSCNLCKSRTGWSHFLGLITTEGFMHVNTSLLFSKTLKYHLSMMSNTTESACSGSMTSPLNPLGA